MTASSTELGPIDYVVVELPPTEMPPTEMPQTKLPQTETPQEELPQEELPQEELPQTATGLTERMSSELASMVDNGMVRILDLLFVRRTDSGGLEVTEFEETDHPQLGMLEGSLAEILALEDVENLAGSIEPGHHAAVIIWEYLCTRAFSDAARADGGCVVALGRIPTHAIVATLETDQS